MLRALVAKLRAGALPAAKRGAKAGAGRGDDHRPPRAAARGAAGERGDGERGDAGDARAADAGDAASGAGADVGPAADGTDAKHSELGGGGDALGDRREALGELAPVLPAGAAKPPPSSSAASAAASGTSARHGVHREKAAVPARERAAATPAPASVSKEAALEALRPYLKDRVVLAASKITEIKRHMEAMQSRYDGLDYQKSLAVERMLAAELSVRQMGDALDAPLDEIVTLWAELREPLVRRARLYDAFAVSSAGRPEVRLYRRAELNRLRYLRQCRLSKGPQSAALARNAELVFEKQREACLLYTSPSPRD